MEENKEIPVPTGKKVLGIIEEELGWGHVRVRCFDGKIRVCRVPKKIFSKFKVKKGKFVLVDPWELEGDKKGDVVYIYEDWEVEWLRKNGYIKIEEF